MRRSFSLLLPIVPARASSGSNSVFLSGVRAASFLSPTLPSSSIPHPLASCPTLLYFYFLYTLHSLARSRAISVCRIFYLRVSSFSLSLSPFFVYLPPPSLSLLLPFSILLSIAISPRGLFRSGRILRAHALSLVFKVMRSPHSHALRPISPRAAAVARLRERVPRISDFALTALPSLSYRAARTRD